MCFTNLPVEFDEAGNPYLDEEAEEIEHPSDCDHAHHDHEDFETVGSVEGEPGPALADLDREEVYTTVLETLPEEARDRVAETDRETESTAYRPAEGD